MKNMKTYISIFLSFAMAAPLFTGCDNGLDEYPSDAPIPAPSDKFTTNVQFVSLLSDASLGTEYDDYLNALDDKNTWMTIADRVDDGNQSAVMKAAWDTERWMTFAFNKMANKKAEGSMLYMGSWGTLNTYITGAAGIPSGNGCYVTEVKTKLAGIRSEKGEDGEVTATKDISFDVNFLTARFETADQISAFGGKTGILRSCYDRNMSLLMIGTVKNDLFAQLESAAKSAAGSYEFKVFNVAAGSQYTIFMLTEERFWGFNGVETKSLTGGISAYNISVMW